MGFLQSPDMIYNTMTWSGYAKELIETDVVQTLKPIQAAGFHWSADKCKLIRGGVTAMATDTPWIHTNQGQSKRCGMDHQICFNQFRIIPPKCLECWKTVVTPTSFDQLMQLREIQKGFNFPCKCGIEVRDYTPKFYGGYHYADSLDEGLEMCEVVREAVRGELGDEVADNVLLKRGCTEYEFVKGPSPSWHMNRREEKVLSLIEHYIDYESTNVEQSKEAKHHVLSKWFLWAHANGDMSYKPYNGGESLFPDYVRYDNKDRATLKEEMALAKANILDGITGEQGTQMLGAIYKAAEKYQVNPNAILDMGHNWRNPLQLEPHVIGDQDELS